MSAAIVGGGIAGLATAFHLQTLVLEARIVLLEGEERLGGKLQTERTGGFIIEGGPDSFLSSKPQALALARELGLEHRLQGVRPETRRTYVMRDGRLIRLPEGLSGLVPARLGPLFRSPLLSSRGKIRTALERFVPARQRNGDESLGSFMRRRMGSEAYERLIEPLMSGIYGGNGDELSLTATFPRLRELEKEYGSLLKGFRSQPALSSAERPPSPFLTPIGGMAEIVDALEQRLRSVEIRRCSPVLRMARSGPHYVLELGAGDAISTETVILATPAYVSADLLGELDPPLAEDLRAISYGSTAIVTLAHPTSALSGPLDGHGYIIPRREGRPVLACTWTSSKFAHRAPEGFILVRGFVGRNEGEDGRQTDKELLDMLRAELRDTLGIRAEPALARVVRWPRSMPQYRVGHLDRLRRIEERLGALPGVYLAGAAYRGVGIPDCIQSGEAAAQQAATHLSSAQR